MKVYFQERTVWSNNSMRRIDALISAYFAVIDYSMRGMTSIKYNFGMVSDGYWMKNQNKYRLELGQKDFHLNPQSTGSNNIKLKNLLTLNPK